MANNRSAILLESGTNEVEFLEFDACGHRFGVNVHKVLQAVAWSSMKLIRIPNNIPGYCGEVALRGSTLPVIALQEHLGLPVLSRSDKPLLLVMEFNQRTTGFLIDEIINIHRISWKSFTPFDQLAGFGVNANVIGTITIDGRVVQILDLESMMGALDPDCSFQPDEELPVAGDFDRGQVRIVYAEDSPTIRKITKHMLGRAGFTNLTMFPAGKPTLDYLVQSGGKVDIVLTDIEMPGMDGLTLCRKLRESPVTRELPIIFYSSMINEQMEVKCTAVGGDLCFSKPDIAKIVLGIEELYRNGRKDQAA